jgi:hypothetical protein
MGYPDTAATRRQRSEASRKHGARSQVVARARVPYVKQSVLQSAGLRYGDLDPLSKRVLDLYARCQVKIEAYDSWATQHGFLDEAGNAPSWIAHYYSAIRTAARLLAQFERSVERQIASGPSPLERHLAENYIDIEVNEAGDG